MTSRSPALAPHIQKLFAARNAGPVEVAVLQPAEPFLDMAGEDLRRRIFLTESETGQTLCLRPEFTIPVCLDHIASQAGTPRRYSYLGEVFRQRREGGNEFFQAGIEDLGDTDIAAADARLVADAHALLTLALPGRTLDITLGDQSIFEAMLAAFGLPRGWRMRLARAFGNDDLLVTALADLKNPARSETLPPAVAALVAEGDMERLTAHISAGLEEGGLPHSGGRTPEDIARRLMEKAELRKVQLPREALKALKKFLAINVPLAGATAALEAFAAGAGLTISTALESFAARVEAMKGQGLPVETIRYDAAFGRPLDYYTGLVFEISAGKGQRALAGGGRYDRLLTLLGAREPIPGVGFSVWLDRIEQLRGDEPLPGAEPEVAGAAVAPAVAEIAAVPDGSAADVAAPEVTAPDVAAPDVTPDVPAAEKIAEAAAPEITTSDANDLVDVGGLAELLGPGEAATATAVGSAADDDPLAALEGLVEPAAPKVSGVQSVTLTEAELSPAISREDVASFVDELQAAILVVPDVEPARAAAVPPDTLAPAAVDQLVDDLEAAIELHTDDPAAPLDTGRKPSGEDK